MMQGNKFRKSNLLLLAMFAAAGIPHAGAQEPLRCVSLSTIDHTEVIDGQTIAFYLTRDRIYVNRLDRTCPNLRPGKAIAYSTSTGQLCSLDSIRVEEFGSALSFSLPCGLGEFEPTDEESLAVMRGELKALDIEPEEIEVEEGADDGEADGDDGERDDGDRDDGDRDDGDRDDGDRSAEP